MVCRVDVVVVLLVCGGMVMLWCGVFGVKCAARCSAKTVYLQQELSQSFYSKYTCYVASPRSRGQDSPKDKGGAARGKSAWHGIRYAGTRSE